MSKQLDSIMRPKAIAVVGASTKPHTIGSEIMLRLKEYDFNGGIYPVNPKADEILGYKVYKSVLDIPVAIDMAIIIVRNDFVLSVIDDCAKKGITGVVIITAGFKETGKEGAKLEQQLADKLKEYGIRAVGPNCLGVVNTDPNIRLDGCFAEELPARGKIGFVSQSGALGGGILNILRDLNVGFSQFISIGNMADIKAEDILEYWENEDDVQQILLYMESISDPKRFRELASRISKKKPIIALKAGRSSAGASAASSHTGSLAGADMAADALLRQCGVIRADSLQEMFETAKVFANCPTPKGNRVAIITNSGGPGIMATDAICEAGMEMAQITDATKEKLRSFLPAAASVKNPVDMIASAPIEHYKQTLETVIADSNVDMIMLIDLPFMSLDPKDVAEAVMEIKAKHPEKPVLGVFMTNTKFFYDMGGREVNIPMFTFSEAAAHGMAMLDRQRTWIDRSAGTQPTYEVDTEKVKQLFVKALLEGRDQLTTLESIDALEAYGIRTCKYAFAKNVDEAAAEANKIGYPVVMKITSTKISHKTEVGGVVVGIESEEAIREEYKALIERLKAYNYTESDLDGMIIQEMVKGSREMVCGIATDPQFGHMMMFGLGGVFVETIKDVTFRIAPLTDIDAKEMIQSVKAYKMLLGARGTKPAQIDQIEETLLRLSQLVKDFSFIKELDINPLKISDKNGEGIAVDGRIQIDMEKAKQAISASCGCCSGCH